MKALLIIALGGGAIWAIMRKRDASAAQAGIIQPQVQIGISRFQRQYAPQKPSQVYAGMVAPPMTSRQPGYVPGFGPLVDSTNPDSLHWNQA
jgi:hypothetical protein